MLTPEYIKRFPDDTVRIFEELEEKIIADISRQFSKDLKLTSTADFQINQLLRAGYDITGIEREIAKTLEVSTMEIQRALENSTYFDYNNEKTLYARGGKELPRYMGPKLEKQLEAMIFKTNMEMKNITGSLGFSKDGVAKNLTAYYQERLDQAAVQLATGAFSREEVVRQTVREISKSGVKAIHWESGHSDRIDTAVRRALRTNQAQISGLMSEQNADMMNQDLMEISSHWGARPSHADWQGQVVSRSGRSGYLNLSDIGYGEGGGFQGYNCRHDWYPFFEGISTLSQMPPEPGPIQYGDKEYTYYEATQYQRLMERQMRADKLEIVGYKAAGLTDEAKVAEIRLRRQDQVYQDFSKKAGIRAKNERTRIDRASSGGGSITPPSGAKSRTKKPAKAKKPVGNYKQARESELIDYQRKVYYQQFKDIDVARVNGYVGSAESFRINEYMYSGQYADDLARQAAAKAGQSATLNNSELFERAKNLEQTLAKAKLPQDMELVRYTSHREMVTILDNINIKLEMPSQFDGVANQLLAETMMDDKFINMLNKKAVGTKYKSTSFTSASFDEGNTVFGKKVDRNVIIKIQVDKGSQGLVTDNYEESEVILNVGQEYEIVSFEKVKRKISGLFYDKNLEIDSLVMIIRKIT